MSSPSPESLTLGADELTFHTTSAESGGALLAFEVRMPPAGGPPALHRHDPAELYRVERREFSFYLAGAAEQGVEMTRPLEAVR